MLCDERLDSGQLEQPKQTAPSNPNQDVLAKLATLASNNNSKPCYDNPDKKDFIDDWYGLSGDYDL